MGARYRLDDDGFREELLNAAFIVAEMKARAERGKEFAESIAPYRAGDHGAEYVHYKESFEVRSGTHGPDTAGREKRERAWAELTNTSDHAGHVEWGNGTPEYQGAHVLTKAIGVMQS